MDDKYYIYCKLFEGSQLMNKEINDRLVPLLTIEHKPISPAMFNSDFTCPPTFSSYSCSTITLAPPLSSPPSISNATYPSDIHIEIKDNL